VTKVIRETPRAINKALVLVGIDRRFLGLIAMVSIVLGMFHGWHVGALAFVGSTVAIKTLTRKDANIFGIGLQLLRLKGVYDPIRRERGK